MKRLALIIGVATAALLAPADSQAQAYTGDYQTNTINVVSNWVGSSYSVGYSFCGLQILSGGVLSNGTGRIGNTGSNNVAIVNGGIWTNSSALNFGMIYGGNQLIVSNGGTMFNSTGVLGVGPSSSNNVAVITDGGVWNNRGNLNVGQGPDSAGNTLTIGSGGSVLANNVTICGFAHVDGNQINVTGGNLTATGTLDIRRGTLTFDGGNITVSQLRANNGASSVVVFDSGVLITGGTTVSNGSPFVVGNGVGSAVLHLQGGTHSFINGLTVSSNATVTGSGSLVGPVTSAGVVSPGDSPGLMTVTGSLTLSNSAVLDLELGGLTRGVTYDAVDVSGTATLDGTLRLSFVNGFGGVVQGGDVFTNLNAAVLLGSFANAASGSRLPMIDGIGSFLVTYGDGQNLILSGFELSAIPEPGVGALILLGGALIWRRSRR